MPNLPGFGAITDTMELVRKMWGGAGANLGGAAGLGIPGMVMPSLSVEDINKQIADLKAVESWLTLNMNLLRGTIQALEVQSATISTLKTMSETFAAAVKPPVDVGAAAGAGKTASAFTFPFGAMAAAPAAPPEAAAAPTPVEEKAVAPEPAPAIPVVNPAAWWNMLQDQFKHAVSTAMTPEPTGKTGSAPATKASAKTAAAASNGAAPARKAAAKRATKTPPRQR
ncbi:MAG: hypothetical protein H7327_15115 [Herminiimonas sp.]|nr:hypothetical protein [Herminiimonas sp.]